MVFGGIPRSANNSRWKHILYGQPVFFWKPDEWRKIFVQLQVGINRNMGLANDHIRKFSANPYIFCSTFRLLRSFYIEKINITAQNSFDCQKKDDKMFNVVNIHP